MGQLDFRHKLNRSVQDALGISLRESLSHTVHGQIADMLKFKVQNALEGSMEAQVSAQLWEEEWRR